MLNHLTPNLIVQVIPGTAQVFLKVLITEANSIKKAVAIARYHFFGS